MAEYRTGVPRREGITGVRGMSTSAGTGYETDNLGFVESVSLRNSSDKSRNEKFSAQKFDPNSGMTVRKWGSPDGQEYEQVKKTCRSLKDIEDDANWIMSMGSVPGSNDRDLPDRECCAWLRINAPSTVESGSTSGISAGNKKGCVYVWSVEECNPSYWGCGAITAAGTGGSGAGVHETSKGVVFIAPTIPDKDTINCGRTVDTKIKVAILTADGKKQLASENGTAGWSGFGMGPGDLLYDLFGPENVCDDTATITTVADDCNEGDCANVRIGYVSNTMGTNEFQGLVALNTTPDMDIRWEIDGGGSISGHGLNIIYASPPSNWNCEENGYIKLFCNNVLVDSLKIYTTIYTHTYIAYIQYKTVCDADIPAGELENVSCPPVSAGVDQGASTCGYGFCYGKCCQTSYHCDGEIWARGYTATSWSWTQQSAWCYLPHPDICYLHGDGYIVDLRALYYPDEACCPPNL